MCVCESGSVAPDSLRYHGWQPTRLLYPWDFLAKYFMKYAGQIIILYISNIQNISHSVVSNSLQPHGLYGARPLCPWNSPGKNIGVDCHSLLQGIFRTQGLNLSLLHCRQILYHLSHQESPTDDEREALEVSVGFIEHIAFLKYVIIMAYFLGDL